MQILNIAGYKFVMLDEPAALREILRARCEKLCLKGTILLGREGINMSLAGLVSDIQAFQSSLRQDQRFHDIRFHETLSGEQPFRRLKVKVKKEIITFGVPELNAADSRAPCVSPAEFCQWIDEKRDITILDTRNDYEIQHGTFTGAQTLNLNDFGEFADCVDRINREKPVVMFCTGGIRCEKAALYLINKGFSHVYQLDGGILGYFAKVGGKHYTGSCFVFDERVAVLPPPMPRTPVEDGN